MIEKNIYPKIPRVHCVTKYFLQGYQTRISFWVKILSMEIQLLRLWFARFLIGIVTFFNLQCALMFILSPDQYKTAFELAGKTGTLTIQGIGLLFIMWNIPYLFALWHPILHRVSLLEAVIMQSVGLVGESIFLLKIPTQYISLSLSIRRFIGFDASGLILLFLSWVIIRDMQPYLVQQEKKS